MERGMGMWRCLFCDGMSSGVDIGLDWIVFRLYLFSSIIIVFSISYPYFIYIQPRSPFSSVGVSLSILPIQIGTNLTFASSNIFITEVGLYVTTNTVHSSHSES